jgi:hypothetical protein
MVEIFEERFDYAVVHVRCTYIALKNDEHLPDPYRVACGETDRHVRLQAHAPKEAAMATAEIDEPNIPVDANLRMHGRDEEVVDAQDTVSTPSDRESPAFG